MLQSVIPSDWQTKHLFVLVGGNPLPNYVAGKTLLAEGGVLHLVHSRDTEEMAKQIAAHFANPRRHEISDPSDAASIEQTLSDVLDKCKDGSIGLNYTGGTKAMAVHAHRVVSRKSVGGQSTVLTYLDAQTLSLRQDGAHGAGIPVQFAVKPDIKTLLDLHGIALAREARKISRRERLNQALAKAHQTACGQTAYEAWCRKYLRRPKSKITEKQAKSAIDAIAALIRAETEDIPYAQILMELRASPCCDGELVSELSQFVQNPIPLPDDLSLQDVVRAMRDTFEIDGDMLVPQQVIGTEEGKFHDVKDLVHYLDGDWVEHLVLAAFAANAQRHHLHECAMSLRTTETPYDFEFDVAAIQGYQLYAVSCTRSSERGLNKSKLFEAYVRARQIGGDEAKVGLVGCDKDPQALEDQVKRVWGAGRGRIRVFGPNEIADLPSHFDDWLTGKEKRL